MPTYVPPAVAAAARRWAVPKKVPALVSNPAARSGEDALERKGAIAKEQAAVAARKAAEIEEANKRVIIKQQDEAQARSLIAERELAARRAAEEQKQKRAAEVFDPTKYAPRGANIPQPAPKPVPPVVIPQAAAKQLTQEPVTVQVPKQSVPDEVRAGGTVNAEVPGGSLVARLAPALVKQEAPEETSSALTPTSQLPSYVIPAALIGGGLLLWLFLK